MSNNEFNLSADDFPHYEENLDYLTQFQVRKPPSRTPSPAKTPSKRRKMMENVSDSDDTSATQNKKPQKRQRRKKEVDPDKELKKMEKLHEKLMITIAKKQKKNIEPGECMKFIDVKMDNELINFDFYNEAVELLRSGSVNNVSTEQLNVPNSIEWIRIIEDYKIVDNKIAETRRRESVKEILIIWRWQDAVNKIKDNTFVSSIEFISQVSPDVRLNLIIYGIEGYFTYHKSRNKNIVHKMYENIKNYPVISRKDLEESLVDIQLIGNCNNKLVENAADVSLIIFQYTKAIAEIPFKLETKNKLDEQMNFYAAGDNRNTIKVDKDGFGLKKLWLKQLCSFNNTTLNVAESICNLYPTPHDLMTAYENCSQDEGQKLLKDIPIKRGAENSTTNRKLGPELSKKIYIMFTSNDPDELLS